MVDCQGAILFGLRKPCGRQVLSYTVVWRAWEWVRWRQEQAWCWSGVSRVGSSARAGPGNGRLETTLAIGVITVIMTLSCTASS